jgi:hypothetical protein
MRHAAVLERSPVTGRGSAVDDRAMAARDEDQTDRRGGGHPVDRARVPVMRVARCAPEWWVGPSGGRPEWGRFGRRRPTTWSGLMAAWAGHECLWLADRENSGSWSGGKQSHLRGTQASRSSRVRTGGCPHASAGARKLSQLQARREAGPPQLARR